LPVGTPWIAGSEQQDCHDRPDDWLHRGLHTTAFDPGVGLAVPTQDPGQ
jgi:hypothetical protein